MVVALRQSIRGASNPWGAVKDLLANLVEVVNAATGSTLSLTQGGSPAGATLTATPAELNKLDDSVTVLAAGAGVSAAETYAVVTTLTETALVTSGGAWTSGAVKGMTALPPVNDYLYIVNGEGSAGGTFTAGKFLIELYGYAA